MPALGKHYIIVIIVIIHFSIYTSITHTQKRRNTVYAQCHVSPFYFGYDDCTLTTSESFRARLCAHSRILSLTVSSFPSHHVDKLYNKIRYIFNSQHLPFVCVGLRVHNSALHSSQTTRDTLMRSQVRAHVYV